MRVVLIGNYAPDRQQSMRRAAEVLARYLPDAGVVVQTVAPPVCLGRLGNSRAGIGKWLGYADKFLLFPRHLREMARQTRKAQNSQTIFHIIDHSNAIYTRQLKCVPHLVTCNDMLAIRSARGEFPENPVRWSGRQFQRMILRGLERAPLVAAISEATRRDLLRLSQLKETQVGVVQLGLNYSYCPMPAAEAWPRIAGCLSKAVYPAKPRLESPFRFILHVGGNQWYKNRRGVLDIFEQFTRQTADGPLLILAGEALPPSLMKRVIGTRLERLVISLTECDNEDLRALYSMAELLIFPSLAEGFGWPVLEAQACGCRVATSNFAPLTEAGGPSAFYLDPRQVNSAAGIVAAALQEPAKQKAQRIEQGFRNIQGRTTEKMVESYLNFYRQTAGNPTA